MRVAEGLELGLVNAVVPVGELEKRVQERADAFASGPSTALALTKRLFHLAAQAPLAEVLAAEADAQGLAARGPEHAEGLGAFTVKRARRFNRTA